MRNLVVVLAVLAVTRCYAEQQGAMVQMLFRVRADDGGVISNAVVGVSTFGRNIPGDNFGRDVSDTTTGRVDTNGEAVLSLPSLSGEASYSVRPLEGYYWNKGERTRFTNAVAGKWQPWNPTIQIVLKRKVNPTSLMAVKYGSGGRKSVPEIGRPIGFDLAKADWVAPYGSGVSADFVFQLDTQLGGTTADGYQLFDATLNLSFSLPDDGIQSVYAKPSSGSTLRLPRVAPEIGYETNLVRRAYRHRDGAYVERREDQNYFFRVRTKRDDGGRVISALYGKIHGEIEFEHAGEVRFAYYLNPRPNDRNLEFDPAKNIFTNLSSLEEVRDP